MTGTHCHSFKFIILVLACLAGVPERLDAKELTLSLVADLNSSPSIENINLYRWRGAQFADVSYFSAHSDGGGFELWRKVAGENAERVSEVNERVADSSPSLFKVTNDYLYITATGEDDIRHLYRVDQQHQIQKLAINNGPIKINVNNVIEWQNKLVLLESSPSQGRTQPSLWSFDDAQGLRQLSQFPEHVALAEVTNLIEFQGDLYVYMMSDPEFEACIFWSFSDPLNDAVHRDVPCQSLAYLHDAKVYNDNLYITGKSNQLLVFDGTNSPEPAFNGNAPAVGENTLLVLDDGLYVAPSNYPNCCVGDFPYLYRIDENGITDITVASDFETERPVVSLKISEYGGVLYVAETTAFWEGEFFVDHRLNISRYLPNEDTLEQFINITDEENSYQAISHFHFKQDELCYVYYRAMYCAYRNNSSVRIASSGSKSSEAAKLTNADGTLFFRAKGDEGSGLWKLEPHSMPTLLSQLDVSQIVPIANQVLVVGENEELLVTSEDNDLERLTDKFPDISFDFQAIASNGESAYIVSSADDEQLFNVWRFDGQNEPVKQFSVMLDNAHQTLITAFDDAVYVYKDNSLATCTTYQFDGENVSTLFAKNIEGRCVTAVMDIGGDPYFYVYYYSDFNQSTSSFGKIVGNDITWLWEDEQLVLDEELAIFSYDGDVYFCAAGPAVGLPYWQTDLFKFGAEGIAFANEICPKQAYSISVFETQELLIVHPWEKGLYHFDGSNFSLFDINNKSVLGNISEAVQWDDSLIIAGEYRDERGFLGMELVQLEVFNDQIVFTFDEQVNHVEINSGVAISLGQMLSVFDSDEGDTVTWDVESLPENGVLDGVPLSKVSDGNTLYPDEITFMPASGFEGEVALKFEVSDGYSKDVILVNITLTSEQDSSSDDSVNNQSTVKGGSVGFVLGLVMVLIGIRRQSKQHLLFRR